MHFRNGTIKKILLAMIALLVLSACSQKQESSATLPEMPNFSPFYEHCYPVIPLLFEKQLFWGDEEWMLVGISEEEAPMLSGEIYSAPTRGRIGDLESAITDTMAEGNVFIGIIEYDLFYMLYKNPSNEYYLQYLAPDYQDTYAPIEYTDFIQRANKWNQKYRPDENMIYGGIRLLPKPKPISP